MKRLLFDYFRRWWWILAPGAALEFKLGGSMAARPASSFEFWGFQLALWMGSLLLSWDLRRGVARAVAPLPLTARQIGRSWWLATVGIPAIALAALLFLGAGTLCHFHPDKEFPAARLALASLLNLLWLGTTCTAILSATRGFRGSGWDFLGTSFFSALSVLMLFGSLLFIQDASKHPFRLTVMLTVGTVLTVVSWFRADQFKLGRPEPFQPAAAGLLLTPLASGNPRREPGVPQGFGGMPFLISTAFARMFSWIAAMIALMALLQWWRGPAAPPSLAITMFAGMGSFMACGFILVFQFLPVLRHLRFLRTLPISASRLAAGMIAITLLPLVALGVLVAGVAGLVLGVPAAITVLKGYTFILAPASLAVFFAVWRGDGLQAYVLLLLTLYGFLHVHGWLLMFIQHPEAPFHLTGSLAAISVLLAFLLTRRAVLHSSQAYRVQAHPFGNVA